MSILQKKIDRRTFLKGTSGALALAAFSGSSFGLFGQVFAEGENPAGKGVVTKPGLCHACHLARCSLLYTVENGVLVHVEGNPEGPWNEGRCCVRGQGAPAFVYNPYRIKAPMKRTNPEKGLDVDPGWMEISWEEALNTIVEKLQKIRQDDPRKLIWMVGFPSFPSMISGMKSIFPTAFGTPNVGQVTGPLCSVHLSNGLVHGGFAHHADWLRTRYVLSLGGSVGPNIGAADSGSDFVISAIKNGTKLVVVDPRCSPEAQMGEWVPIRPGTDFPFLLALTHVILHEDGIFDQAFVKNRTTGPYLIHPEGQDYYRDPETNKPLVWDAVAKQAKPFDAPEVVDYALEGTFQVQGMSVQPAFALLKQGVSEYTPEWSEEITGVPAAIIRRVARELVEAAQIGSTIEIDGVTLPYRPATVVINRGLTGHRDGHLAFWMAMVINQLLGNLAVPGGNLVAADPNALTPSADGVVVPENFHCRFYPFQLPTETFEAREFMPYGFDNTYRMVDVILEPEKYHAEYMPEMFISYAANLFSKAGDPDRISDALRRIPFIVSQAYHSDEHTLFADLVLPDAPYQEQAVAYSFEMYRPGRGHLVNSTFGHTKIVEPQHEARGPDEVWLEVAERLGMLYGPGQLNFMINIIQGFKPEYQLALDQRYSIEEILDRHLRSTYGDHMTLEAFAAKGFQTTELADCDQYNYTYFPDKQTRHPLFNVYFAQAGSQLLKGLTDAGIEHPGLSTEDINFYYRGVPAWKPTPIQSAPQEYDLYGVLWKISQFLFDICAVNTNPWIVASAENNPAFGHIMLNSATAARKGLQNGDMVYVESQYGAKIGPYPIRTTELLHPDCLGVASGTGRVAFGMNPIVRKSIPYNRLMTTDWNHVDVITGGMEVSPRMKLSKA